MSTLTCNIRDSNSKIASVVITYSVETSGAYTTVRYTNASLSIESGWSGSFPISVGLQHTRLNSEAADFNVSFSLTQTGDTTLNKVKTYTRSSSSQSRIIHLTALCDVGSGYTSAVFTIPAVDRLIDSVTIGDADCIRVEDSSSTTEYMAGTYAYITVPYTITGLASGSIVMSVTAHGTGGAGAPTVTLVSSTATKSANVTKTGTFIARASGCYLGYQYTFDVTITVTNTSTGTTQADVVAERTLVLPKGFVTVDFKAGGSGVNFGGIATYDNFHSSWPVNFWDDIFIYLDDDPYEPDYFLTSDTEVDGSKKYYTYDSTSQTYTLVASPVTADIATYYEMENQVGMDIYYAVEALGWDDPVHMGGVIIYEDVEEVEP